MSKIKKLTAIVLSMVMLVCFFAINTSAESIADTAKAISSGKTYTAKLYKCYDKADYKITLNKSGELKLKITTQMNCLHATLYDTNGNKIKASEHSADTGSTYQELFDNILDCNWNSTFEKFSGTVKYKLDKGTYYIRLLNYSVKGSEKVTFKATYPSSDSSENETKADCITIQMKKGDSIQLAFDENTKWTSSDKSVVSVNSDGKITAKKAGTATITAKSGNGTAKINIKVTK